MSTPFLRDLAERVAATFIGALITMLTADASGAVSGSPQQWWLIVGLPTVLALLKGILAGLKDAETGASLLSDPPPSVGRRRSRRLGESGEVRLDASLILGVTIAILLAAAVIELLEVLAR